MVIDASVEAMWAEFRAARPELVGPDDTYSTWHFCDNKADADELAMLVRSGKKRATAGALWAYEAEGEPVPRVGDFSVITDWAGHAQCIIRTSRVEVVPFDEVGEEFAATEGEGDGSLDYWRQAHWSAFGRELEAIGRPLEPNLPVVCEEFDMVFGANEG